jgi:predicted permease
MQILSTIIPIFLVVLLGWIVHQRGFIPPEFLEPANRLVYYVAIPAMIFKSVSRSTLGDWFNPAMLVTTFTALVLVYAASWFYCRLVKMDPSQAGTYIQSAGHGNLGYVGLAVAFYFMGETGLVHASVIAGFLMIFQNLLSVMALQAHAPDAFRRHTGSVFVANVAGNPVILSALAGMVFSAWHIAMPLIIERTLSILSGLALPTALLLIGASLSLERIRLRIGQVLGVSMIKLMLLPAIGWLLSMIFQIDRQEFLPALILLAAPTATITYVMAKQMHGDADLAVATVSASTLLSSITFIFWLKLATW